MPRGRLVLLAAAAAAAVTSSLGAPAGAQAAGLITGVQPESAIDGSSQTLAFRRIRAAGARSVRLTMKWDDVAPRSLPSEFRPTDPADPHYNFGYFDRWVRNARAAGLTVSVSVLGAPRWAQGPGSGPEGTVNPDPEAFGQFMAAAAARYSGRFGGLPRIRVWEAWNEANAGFFLSPPTPSVYRGLLRAFSRAVHGVDPTNIVVAGNTFPFTIPVSQGPLEFMRELLCMSAGRRPVPTCDTRLEFDAWGHHPYTSGGPSHSAYDPDDVSLGDLAAMRDLLAAAVRAGHVSSARPVEFWVTEFSWDSRPPDRKGVPASLLRRWIPEALYRAWKAGITRFTWFTLRDEPDFQSGLYFRCRRGVRCDRPKSYLGAFRFPFVALPSSGRVRVWGRTPGGRPGRVVIEQRSGRRWRRLASLRTDSGGVFTARLRRGSGSLIRARVPGGARSLGFAPRRTQDRPGTEPFGDRS